MPDSRNKGVGESKVQIPTSPGVLSQDEIDGWVEKATNGDYEAFGKLYSTYIDRIFLYVFHQVNDKTAAEDITEDVFIKAWQGVRSCKGRERTFLPWLFRVAHNHVVDTYRKKKRELPLHQVEIDTIADVSDERLAMEKRQEQQQLLSMIGRLPPNQRQVILLKFIEGLDNQEVGQVMHKNQGAVRIMQMRALASLRQIIQNNTKDTRR